jgi:hypothetical protein
MSTVTVIAALIAAAASVIGVILAWKQHQGTRSRQLAELNELVAEIEALIGFGTHASVKRDTAQERLRIRLGGDKGSMGTRVEFLPIRGRVFGSGMHEEAA